MNILNKLFLRSPVFVSVITLLLAVVTAFSSIGFSAWYSAQLQISEINSQYTTIAIPYNPKHAGYLPGGFELEGTYDTIYVNGSMTWIDEVLQNSPVAVKKDDRILLGAYIEGTVSATVDTTLKTPSSIYEYNSDFDARYNDVVFAVKCTSVRDSSSESHNAMYDSDGNLIEYSSFKMIAYNYEVTVEKTLCMRGSIFPEPEEISLYSTLAVEGGEPILEAGKTYLIRGRYVPHHYVNLDTGILPNSGGMYLDNGSVDSGMVYQKTDDIEYALPSDDILPLYAQYEGDLDEFLASDEGRIWTDEIIPAVQKNYSSAKLMLTDNVDSIYWFNTGEAVIVDGRSIDPAEYAFGSDVCIISLTYAELNDISVGDTLDMELYNTSVRTITSYGSESYSSSRDSTNIAMDPLTPEKALGITKKYTVAGIYTAPVGVTGTYAFGPDVIFVPKSSVPGWENLESDTAIPQLHSLMLENGKTEEFDEYMSANGYSDSFLYFDQSYGEMGDSVKALSDNAVRLALSGAALFLVALLVYLILATNKMRPTVLSMRRIGISCGKCLAQSQSALIPLLLCSLAIGTALGAVMFGTVSSLILSANVRLSAAAVVICMCVQLGLMLVFEFASCNSLSRQKLIKNKGVKNG